MKIKANDLEAEAHLALPASGKGPGVLVLHPWWGLNEDIKNVANRLAEAGFVALAPDLYNGRIATTIEQAEEFIELLDDNEAQAIVKAATDQLLAQEACQGTKLGSSVSRWVPCLPCGAPTISQNACPLLCCFTALAGPTRPTRKPAIWAILRKTICMRKMNTLHLLRRIWWQTAVPPPFTPIPTRATGF